MSQSTIAGGYIPVSDAAKAEGDFYTSVPAKNFTINLRLNAGDTGEIVVYLSFGSINDGKNYTVTTTTQTIAIPDGSSHINGSLQGGSGDVSAFFFQILQTTEN